MKRAKIVCTLGPASRTEEVLTRMIDAGLDVVRLNFSHGTYAEHLETIRVVRAVSDKLGRPAAIMQDLQGPKIRIGRLPGGALHLTDQQRIRLVIGESTDQEGCIATPYEPLLGESRRSDPILLSDGLIRLEITDVSSDGIDTVVVEGGILRERAGMNLPGAGTAVAALTAKDIDDLEFGLQLGVDYVALSFVRQSADVEDLRRRIAE